MKKSILMIGLVCLAAQAALAWPFLSGPERARRKTTEDAVSGLNTSTQTLQSAVAALNTATQTLNTATQGLNTAAGNLQSQIGTADPDQIDVAYSGSISATNGATITLTDTLSLVNANSSTNAGTNTVVLVDPGVKGRVVFMYNVGTSNNLAVAKTGNFVSTALDIAPGNFAILTAVATNQWAGK